jgi:hypothetical protein
MENNRFKYRPEIKSIEDLQPGDEFLVGDERWEWCDVHMLITTPGACLIGMARDLIRANVPIERDIPYPEGGAEKWELREGDGKWIEHAGYKYLHSGSWFNAVEGVVSATHLVYAIPKAKPQDKAKPAPKEYTVVQEWHSGPTMINTAYDFKPGDRVTVQRVEK